MNGRHRILHARRETINREAVRLLRRFCRKQKRIPRRPAFGLADAMEAFRMYATEWGGELSACGDGWVCNFWDDDSGEVVDIDLRIAICRAMLLDHYLTFRRK